MTNNEKESPVVDKGKAKATEKDTKDKSTKMEEVKKDKDGKPIVNGKKDDAPQDGEYPYFTNPLIRSPWTDRHVTCRGA